MRLFISYGHDANQGLVHRIKRDLAAQGHECWIDSERIHEQPDWRRSLMDALHWCDWTVGFLSRHAMRPGGITPQELAIAQDLRGGCLTTVLLEPLAGWQVPVSVGHAQWVDMSDWAAQQAAGTFEPWYAAKLAALIERLAPALAERYAAEIRTLEAWLEPVPQKADLDRHLDGFVGREWLADAVEDWRLARTGTRLLWLTGAPGTGKTAFAAWLTAMHRSNVVALNLCRWNQPERCDAGRVVRTLAWFMARRVQDYRAQLLRLMPALDPRDKEGPVLFDRLIAQPLAHCFDGGRVGDRLLLVVDGLDEAAGRQGDALDGLVDVLRAQAPLLPPWVGLMVTSRPEQPAATAFAGLPMLRIDADGGGNEGDLREFTDRWLATLAPPPAEPVGLAAAIVRRAGGSFLYLRKLREAHAARGFPLDEDRLPEGLRGLYDEWFRRQFPDAADYGARIAPLLALILAAGTPVPGPILDAALGWDPVTAAGILQRLGSLFERRADGWAPFHQSLRDWLTDHANTPARHLVRLDAGRTVLAALLWRRFAAADPAAAEPFVIRELPRLAATQGAAVHARWVAEAGDWWALEQRLGETIEGLRDSRRWPDALAWCDLADLATAAAGEIGRELRRWVAVERGDILRLLGRSVEALTAYRASLALAERLAAQYPDDRDRPREVSLSHNRIGDMLAAQGERAGALAAYRAGLAIRERLAAADAGHAGWQRDLSVSHHKIGDMLAAEGDRAGALAAYRAGLAIAESLAAADPGHAGWQSDLSVSHDRIGNMLAAEGDRAGALAAYNAGLAIAKRLAADPGHAGWQRELSVSQNKIGDMLAAEGDRAGALAAYRAGLAIRERLAAADPGHAGWQRDLSISHERIGDMLAAEGDRAGALAAYRAGLAIRERLAAADPGHAGWQRDLFVSLWRLTWALLDAGDRPAACAMARRLDAQARLLAERFPQDRERGNYVRAARALLARVCGPSSPEPP